MTIREVEERTGMKRANIRFYEKEGLLSPAREANAYRDYGEEDVTALLRIKLLRSLDIPVSEIRNLMAGTLSLSQAMDKKRREIGRDRAHLEAADAVCRSIADTGTDYAHLNPLPYLEQLSTDPQAGIPQVDSQELISPWRRAFARCLDLGICVFIWCVVLELVFREQILYRNFLLRYLDTCISLALLLVLEPLCLHFFGTTPGKWILGIRVTGADGGRLSYTDALWRTWGAIRWGMGFNLPVWGLIRQYFSYRDTKRGEPLDWEEGSNLLLRGKAPGRTVAYIAAYVVLIFALSLVGLRSQMPRHLGDLTPAAFVENVNDLADYYDGLGLDFRLQADGSWVEVSHPDDYQLFTIEAPPPLHLHVEDGLVTGLDFSYDLHTSDILDISQVVAVMHLAAASMGDARLLSNDIANIMNYPVLRNLESFSYTSQRWVVRCQVESAGFVYGEGYLFTDDHPGTADGLARLSLEFSITPR